MLTPSSSIHDLSEWVQKKRYQTEDTSSISSSHHFGLKIKNSVSPEQEKALLSSIDEPPLGSFVYKYGHRSFVVACPIADTQLAFKYYHRLNLRRQVGYTLWGSRCMKAWIAGRALHQLGIQTPQPIAIFEKKRFGFLADKSLLITFIAEGVPLPTFLKEHSKDSEKMTTVARHCHQIFDTFAKYRIYHSDTAPKNFIVSPDCSVSVIDLDAVQLAMPHSSWQKKRAKDIKRFKIICSQYPELMHLYEKLK